MTAHREWRVEYREPGSFFAEETVRKVDGEPNPQEAAAFAPKRAYCFLFFQVIVADPVDDGEGGTLTVQPKRVEGSTTPIYWLGGQVLDRNDIRALGDSHRTLLANMEGNDWSHVIRTPFGNYQPFEQGDFVLPEPVRS